MNKFHNAILASAAALSIGAAGLAFAANPMVGGGEMFSEKNIIENAVNSKDHTTLVAAVKAAGVAVSAKARTSLQLVRPRRQ